MNRFDTYQPIKFDVPMFTPDFAALEALQTQKQKILDDFRNQADLVASSIKDDPYDPTVKEKKIKDIMESKDAIVNEMLRNPAKGSQLLSQYQNTLKKDILFGDINKVNARATDYEQKIAQLKTEPLWNDPIWRKGALEEIKNSYGDFQTSEGFGKTKGDDFAHSYMTQEEVDKRLNASINSVMAEKYATQMEIDPTLASRESYTTWLKRELGEKKTYDKLITAALPQIMSDPQLKDYFETTGKFQGKTGQGEIKLTKDNLGNVIIAPSTLLGQKLHGVINENVFDNHISEYHQDKQDKLAAQDAFGRQQTLQRENNAFHAGENAKTRAFEEQKLKYNLALKFLEEEQKQGTVPTFSTMPLTQGKTTVDMKVIGQQIEKIDKELAMPMIDPQREKYLKGIKSDKEKELNEFLGQSVNARKIMDSEAFQQADWQGTNLAGSGINTIADWTNKSVNPEAETSWYGRIGYGLAATIGVLPAVAYDIAATVIDGVTYFANINDYNPKELEKGTYSSKPIPNYATQLTESAIKGQSWDEFLKTDVGKNLKSQSGSESFGMMNSAKEHYKVAQEMVNTGLLAMEMANIPVEAMTIPDTKTKGDYGDRFKEASKNALALGEYRINSVPLKKQIAMDNGWNENEVDIDYSTLTAGLIPNDGSHQGITFKYSKAGDKKFIPLTYTNKVEVQNSGGNSVFSEGQSWLMQSAKMNNPIILDAMADVSVARNMSGEVLKLENLPNSSSDSKGFIPLNMEDPTYYTQRGFNIKKANGEYLIFQDNNYTGEKGNNPADVLNRLEQVRLSERNGVTTEVKTPAEKWEEAKKKAEEFYAKTK